MTEWDDYYEILQIHPSAEPEIIEAAYRKLIRKYHPDVNKESTAEEKTKKINRAYEVLSNPEKRKQYHSEWILKKGVAGGWTKTSNLPEPKPVVDPPYIRFEKVEPGKIQTASFVIRNIGGPYQKIWISNPVSWVRIVHYFSLTDSDELPLQVEIEAEGEEWGKGYTEYIRVKLDEEETQIKIELQTKPEPIRKKVRVGAGPTYAPPPPTYTSPTPVAVSKGFPAWGKWVFGLAILGLTLPLISRFWPSEMSSKTLVPPVLETVPVGENINPISLPDGSKIFAKGGDCNYGGPCGAVYMVGPNGRNQRKIAEHTGFYCPGLAVSPDGTQIAYILGTTKGSTLRIIDRDGNLLRAFTFFFFGLPTSPSWSPDGRWIAFSVQPDDGVTGNDGIYIVNVNNGVIERLTEIGQHPSWSPNGKEIIFTLNKKTLTVEVNNLTVRRVGSIS